MRRLEYTRRGRAITTHAKNATEAVMCLAQVTRERQRLQQERITLEKRMRTIANRLLQLAGAERQLVPVLQIGAPAAPGAAAAAGTELTLQY
ncbi:MAG TPA: hypothetical protein VH417_17640 [Vicinamibacterales bacterium]|jgi:hypothetical protein